MDAAADAWKRSSWFTLTPEDATSEALDVEGLAGLMTAGEAAAGTNGGSMLDAAALAASLGTALASAQATVCADQPSGLSTSAVGRDAATLQWSAVTGATEYDVRRDAGESTEPAETSTSHRFTGLSAGTTYQLEVRARNEFGASGWSSRPVTTEAAADTPSDPAPDPTDDSDPPGDSDPGPALTLTASAAPASCVAGDSVSVSWSVAGGTPPYTVTVDGVTQANTLTEAAATDRETTVVCQASADTQTVVVEVSDSADPAVRRSQSLSWTVTASGPPDSLEAEIRGQILADGRVETRLRWADGTELTPTKRYARLSEITHGRWQLTEPLTHTLNGVAYSLGQIALRLDNDTCFSRIEFTFRPAGGGDQIDPEKRFLTTDTAVNTWKTTSRFQINLSTASGALTQDSGADQLRSGPPGAAGVDGGLMADAAAITQAARSTSGPQCAAAPTGLGRSGVSQSAVTLSWTAVTGATEYDVRRDAGTPTKLASTSTSHRFTGLSAGTTYRLEVRARNVYGPSAWQPHSVTTSAAAPAPPPTEDPIDADPTDDDDDPPPPPTCDEAMKPEGARSPDTPPTDSWEHEQKARRKVTTTVTQAQVRTVKCVDGEWQPGEWTNDGEPTEEKIYGAWECTAARPEQPADGGGRIETISDSTAWVVSAGVANQIRTVVRQNWILSYTWSGPKLCEWQSERTNDGEPYTEKTTLETLRRPSPKTWTTDLQVSDTGSTRVTRVQTTPVCLEQPQKQQRYKRRTSSQAYVWQEPAWVLGTEVVNITPPVWRYRWVDDGPQRLCTLASEEDGDEPATTAAGEPLGPGRHQRQWGADWIEFMVPAEATLQLSAQVTDTGELAPLFTASDGAELALPLSALGGDAQSSEDPTLESIRTSLRVVAAETALADHPAATVDCALAETGRATAIDLDGHVCVSGWGGQLRLSTGGQQLELHLSEAHAWLFFAAPLDDHDRRVVVWVVDLATGSMLTLDPLSGAELSRLLSREARDATGASERLDAVASSVRVNPSE